MRHDQLLTKWGAVVDNATSGIPTWTERLTFCYLAELASQSQRIIECGTFLGASAKVMLDANPDLTLYCIDTFAVHDEPFCYGYLDRIDTERKLRRNQTTLELCRDYSLKKEIDEGRCFLIVGDSEQGAAELSRPPFASNLVVDAVWVDDGHAVVDLQRDIRCLMPFLEPGGLMVGHDWDQPPNDVVEGVLSMLPENEITEPVPRLWHYRKPI